MVLWKSERAKGERRKKKQQAILWSGDEMPRLSLTPVAAEEQQGNLFGLR